MICIIKILYKLYVILSLAAEMWCFAHYLPLFRVLYPTFLSQFVVLYPDEAIIPKMHYLLHYPNFVKRLVICILVT